MLTTRARFRTLEVLGAATALITAGVGVATATPGGVPAIPLNNEQETTGADTGASGFFSYVVTDDQLCYTLEARGLSGARGGGARPPGATQYRRPGGHPTRRRFGHYLDRADLHRSQPGPPSGCCRRTSRLLRQRSYGGISRRRDPRPAQVAAAWKFNRNDRLASSGHAGRDDLAAGLQRDGERRVVIAG